MNDKNTNTTYKATTKLEHTLVRRVEELEQINLRLQVDNEARKLAQQGLRYGQEFLREVISSIEDTYITVFDQNCQVNFIWGSKLLEEKYGIVFQDLMGKDADDINSLLKKEILQAFETNQSFHGELSEDRQGNIIWWDYTLSPIRDEENEMVAVVSAARDITESKKKEKKLRLNSQIMTNLSEGVYLVRLEDGIIVYANPAFEEMFDYNPGEMIGKKIKTVNAPTEKNLEEIIQDRMQILLATGEWHGEVRNIKKDGTYFWCYANVSLFDHPEYGRVIISVHTDITERKKAEVELKESEQRYRTQFEDAFDAIFIAEPETGIIVDCNKAATLLIGRDKSEIIGQHQKTLHPPEMSKGEFTEHFVEYRDGKKEQILETFVITKSGDLKDVAISANLIEFKGKTLMQGIFRDITERIKLKQKLQLFYQINKIQHEAQDLNSLLEKIFNQILKFTNFEMGGIYLPNEDRTVAKLVYSKNLSDDFFENSKEIEINKFPHSSIFIENKAIFTENYFKIDPIVAKKLNMGSVASIPLVSEKKVIGALNIARKESFIFSNEEKEFFISIGEEVGSTIQQFIIQQKLKESLERLKESEERFRKIVENSEAGYFFIDTNGHFQQVNSAWLRLHKYSSPDEIIDKHFSVTQVGIDLPEANKIVESLLQGVSIPSGEFARRCKDGTVEYHSFSVNPVVKKGEIIGIEGFLIDTTESKKIEQQLRESVEKYRNLIENIPDVV